MNKNNKSGFDNNVVNRGNGQLVYKTSNQEIPFKDCRVSLPKNTCVDRLITCNTTILCGCLLKSVKKRTPGQGIDKESFSTPKCQIIGKCPQRSAKTSKQFYYVDESGPASTDDDFSSSPPDKHSVNPAKRKRGRPRKEQQSINAVQKIAKKRKVVYKEMSFSDETMTDSSLDKKIEPKADLKRKVPKIIIRRETRSMSKVSSPESASLTVSNPTKSEPRKLQRPTRSTWTIKQVISPAKVFKNRKIVYKELSLSEETESDSSPNKKINPTASLKEKTPKALNKRKTKSMSVKVSGPKKASPIKVKPINSEPRRLQRPTRVTWEIKSEPRRSQRETRSTLKINQSATSVNEVPKKKRKVVYKELSFSDDSMSDSSKGKNIEPVLSSLEKKAPEVPSVSKKIPSPKKISPTKLKVLKSEPENKPTSSTEAPVFIKQEAKSVKISGQKKSNPTKLNPIKSKPRRSERLTRSSESRSQPETQTLSTFKIKSEPEDEPQIKCEPEEEIHIKSEPLDMTDEFETDDRSESTQYLLKAVMPRSSRKCSNIYNKNRVANFSDFKPLTNLPKFFVADDKMRLRVFKNTVPKTNFQLNSWLYDKEIARQMGLTDTLLSAKDLETSIPSSPTDTLKLFEELPGNYNEDSVAEQDNYYSTTNGTDSQSEILMLGEILDVMVEQDDFIGIEREEGENFNSSDSLEATLTALMAPEDYESICNDLEGFSLDLF